METHKRCPLCFNRCVIQDITGHRMCNKPEHIVLKYKKPLTQMDREELLDVKEQLEVRVKALHKDQDKRELAVVVALMSRLD